MRLASSWHFLPHFSLEQTSLSFVFFPIMQQVNKQGCSLRKEAPSWSYLQITGDGTFYIRSFVRPKDRKRLTRTTDHHIESLLTFLLLLMILQSRIFSVTANFPPFSHENNQLQLLQWDYRILHCYWHKLSKKAYVK